MENLFDRSALLKKIDEVIRNGPPGAPWREVASRTEAYAKIWWHGGEPWAQLGQEICATARGVIQAELSPSMLRKARKTQRLTQGESFEMQAPQGKKIARYLMDREKNANIVGTCIGSHSTGALCARLMTTIDFENPPADDASIFMTVEHVVQEIVRQEDTALRETALAIADEYVAGAMSAFAPHILKYRSRLSTNPGLIALNRRDLVAFAKSIPESQFDPETRRAVILSGVAGYWLDATIAISAGIGCEEVVKPGEMLLIAKDASKLGERVELFSEPYEIPDGAQARGFDVTAQFMLKRRDDPLPDVDGRPGCYYFPLRNVLLAPLKARGFKFTEHLEFGMVEGGVQTLRLA